MIEAAFWGFVAASALVIGAEISFAIPLTRIVVGLIMAFGVGTLLSSIAYELVSDAIAATGEIGFVAVGLLVGAVVFFVGDQAVSRIGGAERKTLVEPATATPASEPASSGRGIALGTVLDGIPESAVLGISLATGGSVSVALLVAIWISNLPEAIGATSGLAASGVHRSKIRTLWWAIAGVSALAAAVGFAVMTGSDARTGAGLQAFAAGALLTMIVDELAPEAFQRSHLYAGLAATAGFVLTIFLIGFE
jgi:ZIP family zinc transporter